MNKKIIFVLILIFVILAIFIVIKNINLKDNEIKITDNNEIQNVVSENEDSNIDSEKEEKKMYVKVKEEILETTLENNSSVDALIEKLKQGDITINMHDYSNFEKVGELGFSLPRNDKNITTTAGDIILYQGNQITIYYDTNSWDFTKLGHIDNLSQDELKKILGKGDVTVTFSLE